MYSSPWSDQPSLHLDISHLKKIFSIQSNNNVFVQSHISLISRGVAQIQQQILQGRPYSFRRELRAYSIPYVQTMFDCLKVYIKMHILQITIFFKRIAYNKGCCSQNMVRCLGRISHYAFKKMMCNCEGHILRAYMYHVFFI